MSPLMHAAVSDNAACAEALLHLKCNINEVSWKNGYTALSWAVRSASADVVSLILDEDKRQNLLHNAPKLLKKKEVVTPPPPLTSAEKKAKEEKEEADTWIDEEDATFMASAPKPNEGGSDNKKEDDDEDDEDDDELLLAANSKKGGSPLLVKVCDSRGDLPIHLLARAYVSKSREKTVMKSALLSKYTTIMAELLKQGIYIPPRAVPYFV